MKKKVLFSASVFHGMNDAATVTVPMIFPLLYSHQFIINKYSHIGILSNLGLLTTFFIQILLATFAHRFEYKHLLLFSLCGLSGSLALLTFSQNFLTLIATYLMMRVFASFYHPIGVATVSKTYAGKMLDFAIGIQNGSGNLGVFFAFMTVGFLAQNFGWKTPLYAWASMILCIGFVGFLSVRNVSTKSEGFPKPDFSYWKNSLKGMKYFILGIFFGGACWATTVYYAPSLFNHKFLVPLGSTGVFLASWIGIGTIVTYVFGYLSRQFGRARLTQWSLVGSTIFCFLLGIAPSQILALISLFFFGAFIFIIYPAFQSFVGEEISAKNQIHAFSIVANVQMLSGAIVVFIAGFLSDKFGIHSPFLLLSFIGALISIYYLVRPSKLVLNSDLNSSK